MYDNFQIFLAMVEHSCISFAGHGRRAFEEIVANLCGT